VRAYVLNRGARQRGALNGNRKRGEGADAN
jgi:hypothetical protein